MSTGEKPVLRFAPKVGNGTQPVNLTWFDYGTGRVVLCWLVLGCTIQGVRDWFSRVYILLTEDLQVTILKHVPTEGPVNKVLW